MLETRGAGTKDSSIPTCHPEIHPSAPSSSSLTAAGTGRVCWAPLHPLSLALVTGAAPQLHHTPLVSQLWHSWSCWGRAWSLPSEQMLRAQHSHGRGNSCPWCPKSDRQWWPGDQHRTLGQQHTGPASHLLLTCPPNGPGALRTPSGSCRSQSSTKATQSCSLLPAGWGQRGNEWMDV